MYTVQYLCYLIKFLQKFRTQASMLGRPEVPHDVSKLECEGVNEPYKQKEVRSLIRKKRLSLIGLNETRVRNHKHQETIHSICPTWSFLTNYSSHPNGRIWVLWNPTILDVTLLFSSDQVIHVQVLDMQNQTSFRVSFLYGHNDYIPRRELWASLKLFPTTTSSSPWMVLGDFNVVIHGREMSEVTPTVHPTLRS